jgi:hypothetical protein
VQIPAELCPVQLNGCLRSSRNIVIQVRIILQILAGTSCGAGILCPLPLGDFRVAVKGRPWSDYHRRALP